MTTILRSCTHPRLFGASTVDLPVLLSDHLHCERKAAENALSLVRRYPHRGTSVAQLSRLAHEETSHVVQVGALMARRGWVPRTDTPNHYARALLAEVRSREPERLLDALLVAAFIEAQVVPIIVRHALAGRCIVKTESPLFEDATTVDMVLDILAERGYHAVYQEHRTPVPERVDLKTGVIISRDRTQHTFEIRFHPPEIRRGHS